MQDVVGHLEGISERGSVIRHPEQVLIRDDDQRIDEFLKLLDPRLSQAHAVGALEMKWLGDHTDRQNSRFAGDARDYRGAAGTGTAAHSGGDERHVGPVHRLEDFVERLFCGGASDIRPRAGAKASGDADPELDLPRRGGLRQRLSVGIAGHELAPDQVRADHIVDGISAGAPHANNSNAGLHLLLVSRNAQIDHAVPLRCNAAS